MFRARFRIQNTAHTYLYTSINIRLYSGNVQFRIYRNKTHVNLATKRKKCEVWGTFNQNQSDTCWRKMDMFIHGTKYRHFEYKSDRCRPNSESFDGTWWKSYYCGCVIGKNSLICVLLWLAMVMPWSGMINDMPFIYCWYVFIFNRTFH